MGLKSAAQDVIINTLKGFGFVKKGATLTDLWNPAGFGLSGGRITNQRQQMESYLDWVYAAATTVAQDAATIDFRAYANRGKARSSKIAQRIVNNPHELRALLRSTQPALEELDNHVLLDLLDRPNPFMDGQTFHEITFLHLQLAGEAFWAKIRNGLGKPEMLWPMTPYMMKEVKGGTVKDFITGWVYRVNGVDIPWAIEDIVHIKLPDPNNLYRGMSIVRAAARAIDTDAHAADWNRSFIENGAEPGFVLETDANLTDDQFKRLKEQWEDSHKGVENVNKVAILEAGLKANRNTMSHKDMDFLESRRFNRDQQLAMFRVSRVMLGLIEGDGRSNMEAAEYNHAKRTLRPIMSRVTSMINHSLTPEYDTKLVIGFTDPVPEDKEFALKERIEATNTYKTINEVRAEIGDEPIPGGDVIYQPLNLVPLGVPTPEPVDNTPVAGEDEGKKGLGKKLSTATTMKESA